jgi:DNA-binding transcriptional MerR regulator
MSRCRVYQLRMQDQELTLEELSERTGVEARTLRSWVSEGLLAPPLKSGRGAKYPTSNADRALAVRALKDLGLSLAEIGRRFLLASDQEVREWASAAGQTSAPRGSARDYIKLMRGSVGSKKPSYSDAPEMLGEPAARVAGLFSISPGALSLNASAAEMNAPPRPQSADRTKVEHLILALERLLTKPPLRRSSGTTWTRISITPDLELSVRGDLAPAERLLFEQLADQLRAILTGAIQV